MSWFKKIFRRNEGGEAEETVSCLALSDLQGWLDKRSYHPGFEKTVQDLYAQIGQATKGLDRGLKELEAASPPEDAHPRLLKAGTASRDAVRKQMELLSEKLEPPSDIDSAEEYHSVILKHLENTVQKFDKARKYTAALFPEESETITTDLSQLTRLLAELGEAIDGRKRRLRKFEDARELAIRVQEGHRQMGSLESEISEKEGKLAQHRASEKGLLSELDEVKSSEEGRRRETLKEDLDKLRRALEGVEAEMVDLVSPMTKALRRLIMQDSSDRISLRYRSRFEQLIASPTEALEKSISGPLEELRSNVDSLGLRSKKKERILEQIDHLLETKVLEDLKARHADLSEEVRGIKREITEGGRETARLEEEIIRAGDRIGRIEAELDQARKSLVAMEKEAARDESDLRAAIEKIAGRPLEIDMGNGC